jgi:VIT1/CCC1 family predicted Fe2+/Mn2+ transporter
MTSWQYAAIPFWVSGFIIAFVAISVGLGVGKKPGETAADLLGQSGTGLVMALPLLILAAWLAHAPVC